jgi:hypothetical protein
MSESLDNPQEPSQTPPPQPNAILTEAKETTSPSNEKTNASSTVPAQVVGLPEGMDLDAISSSQDSTSTVVSAWLEGDLLKTPPSHDKTEGEKPERLGARPSPKRQQRPQDERQ